MNILIVVDMQNDFVTGSLGTKEAVDIVPYVLGRTVDAVNKGDTIIFTRDTHGGDYMQTLEGRNLPVPHCISGTEGWQIIPQLTEYTEGKTIIDKPTFGSAALASMLFEMALYEKIDSITLIGLCTDICVISNALLIKAFLPEAEIIVDSACCAGVTPRSHENALEAMKMCQIKVI